MKITRWEPFKEITSLAERLNRLFDEELWRFPRPLFEEPLTEGSWRPEIDVYETKDAIILKADLPGIDKSKINVDIKDGMLRISGERKEEKEIKEQSIYRLERRFGSFQRYFSLPDGVAPDKIKAEYKDGILHVTVPKTEERKTREIKVEVH